VEKVDEFADIWATPLEQSNNIKRFKDFSSKTASKVKAVITPLAGQSFNPSAQAHKDVLKQVVAEEVQEIEKNLKGTIKQHALATVTNQPSESESSSESDDQAEELTNKPVQREKKKTQTEINKKVSILTLPSDV
jgi:hypothetical protein